MHRWKSLLLAGAILHLLLIAVVSLRDTFTDLASGHTILPPALDRGWQRGEHVTSAALGQQLPRWNPIRQVIGTYLNAAGVESGYGFFAPQIPQPYKLVFELHYLDGRVEYDLPTVSGHAAGLRVVSLLDLIGRLQDSVVREAIITFLVHAVRQQHENVSMIRAVFGTIELPSMAEFEKGKKETYAPLFAYDFTFGPAATKPASP